MYDNHINSHKMVGFDTSHKRMGGHGQEISLEYIFAKKMKLPMYFKRQFLYIKFFNHLEGGFVKSKLSTMELLG